MTRLRTLLLPLVIAAGAACQRPLPPSPAPAAPVEPRVRQPAAVGSSAPVAAPAAPASAAAPAMARAAASPTEAYDLASDVTSRRAAVAGELGPGTRVEVVADVFVVAGPATYDGASFASTLGIVRRALDAYFNERFERAPTRAVSVLLFADAATYDGYCQASTGSNCTSPYGFYLPGERRIVMNIALGIGTLTHELVHPIIESDFPDAPTWIDEGIASLFENFGFPAPGEVTGYTNWRLPRLQQALRSAERDEAQLDRLFGMSDTTFRAAREDLHYAMARYLCQWLDRRGELWPFYQRWRESFDTDPTGALSFQAATGLTPAAAAPVWRDWVLAL